jgi:hypothetical protein
MVLTNTTSRQIRYTELQNGNVVNSARRTGVLMCAQHAREVFSVEVCYWLTRFMATDVDSLLTFPEVQTKLLATGKFGSGTVNRTLLLNWITDILNKMRLIVSSRMARIPTTGQRGLSSTIRSHRVHATVAILVCQ